MEQNLALGARARIAFSFMALRDRTGHGEVKRKAPEKSLRRPDDGYLQFAVSKHAAQRFQRLILIRTVGGDGEFFAHGRGHRKEAQQALGVDADGAPGYKEVAFEGIGCPNEHRGLLPHLILREMDRYRACFQTYHLIFRCIKAAPGLCRPPHGNIW